MHDVFIVGVSCVLLHPSFVKVFVKSNRVYFIPKAPALFGKLCSIMSLHAIGDDVFGMASGQYFMQTVQKYLERPQCHVDCIFDRGEDMEIYSLS
jgi:hypothetical protein